MMERQTFVLNLNMASMDFGVGAAMGAQVAVGKRDGTSR